MKSDLPAPARRHGTALAASLLLVTCGFVAIVLSKPRALPPEPPLDITVQHTAPLTLSVTLGEGKGSGLMEWTHTSSESITIQLPASWTLRQVRYGTIEALQIKAQENRTKWTLNGGAVLSLTGPRLPDSLTVRHDSPTPLQLKLSRINVRSGAIEEENFLLKDSPTTIQLER